MAGNVVIPGMTTVGGDDLPIAGPALALAGFMVSVNRKFKYTDRCA